MLTYYFQKAVTDESIVATLGNYNLKESNQILCFTRDHPSTLVIVNTTDNTLTNRLSLISKDDKNLQVCQLEPMLNIIKVDLVLMKLIV